MKNRLQIRYHFPQQINGKITLPTRDEALSYIKNAFERNTTTNNGNTSLIAEPLVIFYNDNTNATPDAMISKSNVILAIGRGGNGENVLKNEPYFIIDFAKHDEDIQNAFDKIAENEIKINDIFTVIEQIQNDINAEVNRAINEETVIKNLISIEQNRAEIKESELQASIQNASAELITKIQNSAQEILALIDEKVSIIKGKISYVQEKLNTEVNNRTSEIARLETKINDNTQNINKTKVSSSQQTIKIDEQETTTNIDVNIDNETIITNNGIISVKINDNDNILSANENGLTSSLSLKWVKNTDGNTNDEIQLIGKNNIIISRIDIADFLKNDILNNVELDVSNPDQPKLVFSFYTDAGEKVISLDVRGLIKAYLAGDGLELNNNTFSVKIDTDSEAYLTVGENGLKLSGITQLVNNNVNNINSQIITLTETINRLTNTINELSNKIFNIEGTDNEIDVICSGNTATIKFADDAYFVAGI